MAKHKRVPRAGFIPYFIENGEMRMMFMRPSDVKYGGREFQIAKGKVEDGEYAENAALREAGEELGLLRSNIVSVDYLGLFLGYTEIYYGPVRNMDDFGETTFETAETIWMTPEEFFKTGRSIHVPIIKSFLRKVSN